MRKKLIVATVYKVQVEYAGLCNDELTAFMRLIDLFEVEIHAQNDDNSEYLFERAELEHLRDILSGDNKTFTESAEDVEDILSEACMTRERMLTALDVMITRSDQDDSLVHLFCE